MIARPEVHLGSCGAWDGAVISPRKSEGRGMTSVNSMGRSCDCRCDESKMDEIGMERLPHDEHNPSCGIGREMGGGLLKNHASESFLWVVPCSLARKNHV